jgi:SAM-dependent methyltransferase
VEAQTAHRNSPPSAGSGLTVLYRLARSLPAPLRRILRYPYRALTSIWSGPAQKGWNWGENQVFWDDYARRWSASRVAVDDPGVRAEGLTHLGDEWGRKQDVLRIVQEYISPFVNAESVVGEIGCGGGRVAVQVAGMVKELYCFDISVEMLERARAALAARDNVHFLQLRGPHLVSGFMETFDFMYSFDVFVHLDLMLMWKYFSEIALCLRPGGKAFLHTANLATPAGWEYFRSQEGYGPTSFYFISPEVVDILAARSNLRIIKKSHADPTNFYLNRDYLFVVEKPPRASPEDRPSVRGFR